MRFVVTLKGVQYFCGYLNDSYDFVAQKWGNLDEAWDRGVKLIPADRRLPRR